MRLQHRSSSFKELFGIVPLHGLDIVFHRQDANQLE